MAAAGVLLCSLFTLLVAGDANKASVKFSSPWTYNCKDKTCVKSELGNQTLNTLNKCKLTCGPHGALWPRPAALETLGTEVTKFFASNITQSVHANEAILSLLNKSLQIFRDNLNMYHPNYNLNGKSPWSIPSSDSKAFNHRLNVEVRVATEVDRITLNTDESYKLNIKEVSGVIFAEIVAETFFGARHGIETLSQLVNYDQVDDCLQIVNSVKISNDTPTFSYRGLLIDTARNFIPVKDIHRTLDAMSANKLNTFHWHITDTDSFPVVIKSVPKMIQYGAYSSRKIYEADDVKNVVEYGRIRGIRVMPEFDAPAHVGNGWQWGPKEGLGKLAVCVNQDPWSNYCYEPPCGQLNIANKNIYKVLGSVYHDLVDLFQPLDLFHFGGDEININCWNSVQEIRDWMKTVGDKTVSNEAYYLQWSNFQNKSFELVMKANNNTQIPGIIWTSKLTENDVNGKYLNKDKYIVQIWSTAKDPIIAKLLKENYRVIFSNYDAWYLDCGSGAWIGKGTNWCSPYKGWQTVYDNSPYELAGDVKYHHQVIGGEAALWNEQIDEITMDSKLWPRASALAERLWTNPSSGWRDAEYRLIHHRQRMVERGINADRIQPEWCHQNEGECE